ALAVHEALGATIEAQDHRAYHRESRRFHLALLAPSRMQRLQHVYELAWNVTEPAQPMSSVEEGVMLRMHADHAAMLAAFTARDTHELLRWSRKHYRRLERAVEGG
ncbi:MAG: FCD domain-containing protein, partial [Nocardioidaceae bacterium]